LPEKKIVLKGKITGVALNAEGKPYVLEEFKKIIESKI
jgi:hypothetical protein